MQPLASEQGVASHRDRLPERSRYRLLVKIGSGGMGTVYVGCNNGVAGFRRLVAIKRAHAHLLDDGAFRRMLIKEARLASKMHHPNVVAVHDVEELDGELLLVMDYIEGASLEALLRGSGAERLGASEVVRIILDASSGLAAAHHLKDDHGTPLGLIHRDVSPHNIVVGTDGITRILDFGIAKSKNQTVASATRGLKGKVGYMAPEYIETGSLDARGDLFALAVVLWEALVGKRLFRRSTELESLKATLEHEPEPLSVAAPSLGTRALDAVVQRALRKVPDERFEDVRAFADALEGAAQQAGLLASHHDVGRRVVTLTEATLTERRALIHRCIERGSDQSAPVLLRHEGEWAFRPDHSTLTMSTPASAGRVNPRRVALGALAVVVLATAAAAALTRVSNSTSLTRGASASSLSPAVTAGKADTEVAVSAIAASATTSQPVLEPSTPRSIPRARSILRDLPKARASASPALPVTASPERAAPNPYVEP